MHDYSQPVSRKRLIIRVSRKSLSFSVLDSGNGQISFIPYPLKSGISLSANLREAFRDEEILNDKYQHVLVSVVAPTLTVPTEQFKEQEKEILFRHAFTNHEQDYVG